MEVLAIVLAVVVVVNWFEKQQRVTEVKMLVRVMQDSQVVFANMHKSLDQLVAVKSEHIEALKLQLMEADKQIEELEDALDETDDEEDDEDSKFAVGARRTPVEPQEDPLNVRMDAANSALAMYDRISTAKAFVENRAVIQRQVSGQEGLAGEDVGILLNLLQLDDKTKEN